MRVPQGVVLVRAPAARLQECMLNIFQIGQYQDFGQNIFQVFQFDIKKFLVPGFWVKYFWVLK